MTRTGERVDWKREARVLREYIAGLSTAGVELGIAAQKAGLPFDDPAAIAMRDEISLAQVGVLGRAPHRVEDLAASGQEQASS